MMKVQPMNGMHSMAALQVTAAAAAMLEAATLAAVAAEAALAVVAAAVLMAKALEAEEAEEAVAVALEVAALALAAAAAATPEAAAGLIEAAIATTGPAAVAAMAAPRVAPARVARTRRRQCAWWSPAVDELCPLTSAQAGIGRMSRSPALRAARSATHFRWARTAETTHCAMWYARRTESGCACARCPPPTSWVKYMLVIRFDMLVIRSFFVHLGDPFFFCTRG